MGLDTRRVRGLANRTTTPNASRQPNDLASGTRKEVFGGVGTKFFCGELEEVEKGFLFRRIRLCGTLVGRAAHKIVKSRKCRAFPSIAAGKCRARAGVLETVGYGKVLMLWEVSLCRCSALCLSLELALPNQKVFVS